MCCRAPWGPLMMVLNILYHLQQVALVREVRLRTQLQELRALQASCWDHRLGWPFRRDLQTTGHSTEVSCMTMRSSPRNNQGWKSWGVVWDKTAELGIRTSEDPGGKSYWEEQMVGDWVPPSLRLWASCLVSGCQEKS